MTKVGGGRSNQSSVISIGTDHVDDGFIWIEVITHVSIRCITDCCHNNPDLEGGIREFPVSFCRGLYEKTNNLVLADTSLCPKL